jgi:hypothetical protein
VGVVLFGLFVLTAIIGPLVTPYDPSYQNPNPNASMNAPSAAHLLGTTQSGQDVLSQLLVGIRLTLELGIIVGVVATALAVIVGVTAAFLGGFWDELLSLLTNVFLVIPALPLLIVLLGYFPNPGRGADHHRACPARLAVGGSGDAGPDPGHPQSRLRGRVPGDRGENLADHHLRDRPQRGEPDRGELREHGAVRHRGLGRPGLHLAYGACRLLRAPALVTTGSVIYRGRRVSRPADVLKMRPDELRRLRWREIAIVLARDSHSYGEPQSSSC